MEENTKCNLHVTQEGSEVCPLLNFNHSQTHKNAQGIDLQNVWFGEVWICSGQSNMQMGMGEILNSTEEMARMADYPMIRMYSVQLTTSETPMDDLVKENPFQKTSWARTTDTFPADPNKPLITYFSAVCLLYATNIADVYGKDKVFGLIESNWGGTIIEAWMPPEPLDACGIEPCCDDGDQNSNSVIYNAMIHPLVSLSLLILLWPQLVPHQSPLQATFDRLQLQLQHQAQ